MPPSRKQQRRQKAVPAGTMNVEKPQVGQTIVLKGGTKSKRKYNNEEALVTEVPTRGCWMTVQIQASNNKNDNSQTVKWRKGSFRPVVHDNKDPLTQLNDESVVRIFSFLFGDCPTRKDALSQTKWLIQAIKPHGHGRRGGGRADLRNFMLVNKLWNTTFNRILPNAIGPVSVDLQLWQLEIQALYLVRWLGQQKVHGGGIKLSSLLVHFAELGDIPYLTKLFTNCDTENLTTMELSVNRQRQEATSWSTFAALDTQQRTVSLTNPTDEEAERARQMQKTRIHASQVKDLHDLVAEKCYANLTDLSVTITLPCNSSDYTNYISTNLFSLSSIQTLSISLGYFQADTGNNNTSQRRLDTESSSNNNYRIDSGVITKLVQNLTNLTRLNLSSPNSEYCYQRRYNIESTSLQHIDVTKVGKGLIVSCSNCPNLQTYRCKGGVYGNGTLPILTPSQHAQIDRYMITNTTTTTTTTTPDDGDYYYFGGTTTTTDLVVTAGTFEFPHFDNIPDTCRFTLVDYNQLMDHERYNRFAQEWANATYETF